MLTGARAESPLPIHADSADMTAVLQAQRQRLQITARLGAACQAVVHGQVLGSGLEMAAFCGQVTCHPGATLGLPGWRWD